MAKVIGKTVLEQGLDYSLEISGNNYTRTWRGVAKQIDGIAAGERRFAESVQVKRDGATATVTARYSFPVGGFVEVPQETQELTTEMVSQSIFANKNFAAIPPDVVLAIRKEYEQKPDKKETDASEYAGAIRRINLACTAAGFANNALAKRAFDLLQAGTENYEIPSFTLTRTRTVSRRYSQKIALGDVDKIFTTDQLKVVTGNPTLFDVPSLTLTADEIAKNLMAGWRKRECRVTDVANGSRQMIEVWSLAKWSLDLYDAK